MKKEFNADWAIMLDDMLPTLSDNGTAVREKWNRLSEFIKEESDGAFLLSKNSQQLIQNSRVKWSYIFDVIKNAPKFGYKIALQLPPRFRLKNPNPEPGWMYASYDENTNAVRVRVFTGNLREDLSGYDGFGREPDEFEVVEGLRDRDGNWIQNLNLTWI